MHMRKVSISNVDGECIDTIEMHGHSTTSMEGVAADIRGGVAKVVEANIPSSRFDSYVDVFGSDVAPGVVERVVHVVDWGIQGATMGKNVGHPAGKGLDWAVRGVCALMMDALAFDTILLVGHVNGGFSSHEESGKGAWVGMMCPWQFGRSHHEL